MTVVHRVLPPEPVVDLADHLRRRGGEGLARARQLTPDELIAEVAESGLRGRGGAGFPTGIKWRTVRDYASSTAHTSVVVNAAEGEPGTFKDRTLLRMNPYEVIEGALIAARAVGADQVAFGLKASFGPELARLRTAIAEVTDAGWAEGVELDVFEGPNEYLYGEETALLETLDGRYPFPRLAPPYRRGLHEVVETSRDVGTGSNLSAHVEMAGPGGEAPPTLVDNTETLANIPRIIARGAAWFRTEGTEQSPGTIVCTVTGSTDHHGVAEVQMGTPLREVIDVIGGGPRPGRRITAVLSGVSNALIPASQLDTPVTYEDLAAIGSGLGSAGFVVFDDTDDLVAAVAGVSRFLAVESCGQCTPCKQDGLALAGLLEAVSRSTAGEREMDEIRRRLDSVAYGARCFLATQQQVVVTSLLDRYPEALAGHLDGSAPGVAPTEVAEMVDLIEGQATIDERHRHKQPDWSYDEVDSGQSPADRFDEHRSPEPLPEG
jgi:NADH:ubiquinone oxidoreductase subunit F (NADH-binding)